MEFTIKSGLLAAFVVCTPVFAHDLQPLELVEKIMTDGDFVNEEFYPQLVEYATAEYLSDEGHPNFSDIKSSVHDAKNMQLDCHLLNQVDDNAVVNVKVSVTQENPTTQPKTLDTYFHLKKTDDEWKVSAFRYLAMTGMTQKMYDSFSQMSEKQINAFIDSGVAETIKTRADFDFYVNNLRLLLASDDELTKHFLEHKSGFESIIKQVMDKHRTDIEITDKSLLITDIIVDELLNNQTVSFEIGGVLDNTVGYLYVPKGVLPPQPYANYLIMLRDLGDGWYLYKTT